MESRSFDGSKRERVKVSEPEPEIELFDEAEEKPEEKITAKSSETVQLVLLRNLKLNYTGPVTGKLYVFPGAGAVLDIDAEDAEIMLQKRGGVCCEGAGSQAPQPYFAKL